MSAPPDLPEWATDANYPAGGATWNGTATKVTPAAGKQAEGFEPIEKPGAQHLNWLFNLIYLWLLWIKNQFVDPQWVWLPAGAGTPARNSDGSYAVPLADGIAGVVGQVNGVFLAVRLPVGMKLIAVGMRMKHVAGEPAPSGGTIAALQVVRSNGNVYAPGGGAAPNSVYITANPPTAINPAVNAIEFLPNSGAGALWEFKTAVLDTTGDVEHIDDQYSYCLYASFSGDTWVETVGYQYAPI